MVPCLRVEFCQTGECMEEKENGSANAYIADFYLLALMYIATLIEG